MVVGHELLGKCMSFEWQGESHYESHVRAYKVHPALSLLVDGHATNSA